MSEKNFEDRKKAAKYFAGVESGDGFFTDESGELRHILKNPNDESRFSQLLSSFASTEDRGIATSLEEIEALIQQGKELGYNYTAGNIRTEIAKRRKNKNR